MATDRKHTHRGHCQACAAHQAVSVGGQLIAKHGYTTRWGYFAGTCSGSGRQPLELATDHTREVQERVTKYAADERAMVARYRSGEQFPAYAEGDRCVKLASGKWGAEQVQWADATDYQRERTLKARIGEGERNAKHADGHVAQLDRLVRDVFGRPLYVVKREAALPAIAPGLVYTMNGYKYRVLAVLGNRWKPAQYVSSVLDGNPESTARTHSFVVVRKALRAAVGGAA